MYLSNRLESATAKKYIISNNYISGSLIYVTYVLKKNASTPPTKLQDICFSIPTYILSMSNDNKKKYFIEFSRKFLF